MLHQPDLVIFCHLRWDFVFQRPQHLLSRLARDRRVIFIEEPILDEGGQPHLELKQVDDNLLVVRPHSPIAAPGFAEEQLPILSPLVENLVEEQKVERCIGWFYTPLALPLLEKLPHELVVYDCMDALDAFLHAPPLLKQREVELLAVADLVFTGGPSLFRRLEGRHPHAHCFASSVDAQHFAKAKSRGSDPVDQATIGLPRLGYFGVIDERIDLQLLDDVAAAHPEWQIVMVGPVVKISQSALPRRDNIHYLGQKQYAELPQYLSGWDVCLLPFAQNESTRYISPTKTLEYMVAEKPIVSTPITDVAEPYGHIVYLAADSRQFISECEQALNAPAEERARQASLMRKVLAATSWDSTAQRMEDLMHKALAAKHARRGDSGSSDAGEGRAGSIAPGSPGKHDSAGNSSAGNSSAAKRTNETGPARVSTADRPKSIAGNSSSSGTAPVVVIGAGPTGLSAAYHLGEDALLLEKNETVGGWCRSVEKDGFTFDFAGHIMFSNDDYVHQLYKMLLGENVHWQDREAWIYSKRTFTRYPFQGALYGLPPEVITECIMGAIEARFGPAKEPVKEAAAASTNGSANGNGHASVAKSSDNGHANGSPHATTNGNGRIALKPAVQPEARASICHEGDVKDCCGDGLLESTARLVPANLLKGRGNNGHDAAAQSNGHAGNGHASYGHASNGHALPAASGQSANGHSPSGNGQSLGQSAAGGPPANFEEFIYKVWGAGIAKHFAIPYNRKLWAVPLSEMETSWLGGRVPMPDLQEMIEGALRPVPKPMGPNARFGYPLRGGFQALMDGFLPHVQDRLMLGRQVVGVSPSAHALTLDDGTVLPYEHLVSTMPLPVLIRLMGDEAPEEVRTAAAGLRYVSVRCVHLGIGREALTDKHWIYYPEETVFHRIFVQGNASPYCNAPGGFGLTCEITYSPHKPLPCDGDALVQRCIDDCRSVGIIRDDDPVWTTMQVDMPFAYVVYDHARPQNVATIRNWLNTQDVILAGRYSEWEYYNSDHAFIAGKKAAEAVMAKRRGQSDQSLSTRADVIAAK